LIFDKKTIQPTTTYRCKAAGRDVPTVYVNETAIICSQYRTLTSYGFVNVTVYINGIVGTPPIGIFKFLYTGLERKQKLFLIIIQKRFFCHPRNWG